MGMSSEFTRSYNSFSGVDIRAVFKNQVIGTLQAISWSVTREKAPIYTMGAADPRSFSRGKRGIAGSMVFIQFDKHAVLGQMNTSKFWSDIDDLRPLENGQIVSNSNGVGPGTDVFGAETPFENPTGDQELATPWYVDQIPPFDVTLHAANEYGAAAQMRVLGIEFLNEGSGVSIDDIVIEHQVTYVCRSLTPWVRVRDAGTGLNANEVGAST